MAGRWGDKTAVGAASAVTSVALGLLYLGLAGAPTGMLAMNGAALAIGLVLLVLVTKLRLFSGEWRGALLIALSSGVAATSLFGLAVDGATRWAVLAGLVVQPSLMIVPLLVIAHAARPDRSSRLALAITVVAIAWQPDRAVAAMLLAGTIAAAGVRDWRNGALVLLAAAGFGATLLQPDRLPAVPFVDQVLFSAGETHLLAGVAVWLGTLILFVPGLALLRSRSPAARAFLAVWAAAVIAALLHNFPTPLVGFGASPIIGYLLGIAGLHGCVRTADGRTSAFAADEAEAADTRLKFA